MMAMPIMVNSSVKTINTRKSGVSQIRERTIVYEGSSGPRELLEAIVIQAQAARKGLEGTKPPEAVEEEMTEEQKRAKSVVVNSAKGKGRDTGYGDSPPSDENQRLLDFCNRILATAAAIDRSLKDTKGDDFLHRLKESLPKVPSSMAEVSSAISQGYEKGPSDVGATEEETMKIYTDWATRVRFEYCDLSIPPPDGKKPDQDWSPNYKFFFNNEARMLANAEVPKRALAIAKEVCFADTLLVKPTFTLFATQLAVLTTNLPVAWNSSIFLRVDEGRVDIIKALITGPEGTPYVQYDLLQMWLA